MTNWLILNKRLSNCDILIKVSHFWYVEKFTIGQLPARRYRLKISLQLIYLTVGLYIIV